MQPGVKHADLPIVLHYFCTRLNDKRMTTSPEHILTAAGIKPTSNRITVLRELINSDHPQSLPELDDRLDTLEKSSIFRVLTTLLDHHVVHAIEDGRGIVNYELCHSSEPTASDDDLHPHFYCESCHQVYCFDTQPIPPVEIPDGFTAHTTNYMVKGICPKCNHKKG